MNISRFYQPTVLLALALLAVITMMILPMPAFMLDLGLTVSFALSILVFTNTLFITRPLDFSAFPTVLLASLMLRLSLNISSTKLIIGEGHNGPHAAGEVIEGFVLFVVVRISLSRFGRFWCPAGREFHCAHQGCRAHGGGWCAFRIGRYARSPIGHR